MKLLYTLNANAHADLSDYWFKSVVRTHETHDIFRKILSVTASLQRPRRCYGARMAFHCVPTEFLVAILCALKVLSLRVHGATVSAPRFHGVATALTAR